MPTEELKNQSALPVEAKTQPWKAHWPPQTPVTAGEKHGFQKGETIQLEGTVIFSHLTDLEKEGK